jgi:hypothetical protein
VRHVEERGRLVEDKRAFPPAPTREQFSHVATRLRKARRCGDR